MQLIAVVTTSLFALALSVSTSNGVNAKRQHKHIVASDPKEYIVGLRATPDGDNFCVGALISPTHVLSPSSCMLGGIDIRWASIGSRFFEGTKDGERIKVVAVMNHPDYNITDPLASNDFMVLELKKPSRFNHVGLPAADDSDFKPKERVATLGWRMLSRERGGDGRTHTSYQLQRVDIKLVSDKRCSRTFPTLDPSMVCAGGASGEDSSKSLGGPLVLEGSASDNEAEDVLIGLLSLCFENTCEAVGSPSVYSRVSTVRAWIDTITGAAVLVLRS